MATSTQTTKVFQERLEQLITSSGKDIRVLAKEIGISTGSLSKYQNDAAEAGINALKKIACYFGVSCDWLLGGSETKSADNDAINKRLGLNDGAIEVLTMKKGKTSYIATLNYLIQEHSFLYLMSNYLFEFAVDALKTSNYKYIPLKSRPLKFRSDILFAAIIKHLTIIREDAKATYINDKDLIEKLFLEYLERFASIDRCNLEVYGTLFRGSGEDVFDLYDQEMDDSVKWEISLDEEVLAEQYLEEKREAILDFLEYLKKKGGCK